MKTKFIVFIGFFLLFFLLQLNAQNNADLILFNGKIITVDNQDNIYTAIAVKGDTIIAAGSDSEMLALGGSGCTVIDLEGRTATPGLIDSHYHMMYYGAQFWPGFLNIRHPDVAGKADLLQVIGNYVQGLNPDEWVSGNQGFMIQQSETLDRWDLDSVAPVNPVYIRHFSGQYSVVNSLALEIAGIDSTTENPHGSLIFRDSLGNPTGVLSHYPAENLVGQYAKGYGDRTDEQKLEDIELGQSLCFEAGYTSVQDVIVGSLKDILLYKQFADEGRLKIRLYALLYLDTEAEADTLSQIVKNINSGLFTFGGWKLAMDGGPAARTTLFYDRTLFASEVAYPYHSQEEMNRIVQILHDTGLQIAVHVGGDEGIDMTIAALEQAIQNNPRPDPRHRIEHGLFPTSSAIQKMKDNNIIVSTQPQWLTWYGDGYIESTNETEMNKFLPLKTMLDEGVNIAFGCDVPASPYQEPKWAFHGATLRRSGSGTQLTQAEKLTMQEALRIHTMGSAYASFSENTTGSLEPGKFADIVVWSHDLYTMPPSELINLQAEVTIVGGEIVYNRGNVTSVPIKNETTGVIPDMFILSQNYPNPFNPTTNIEFALPSETNVQFKVFDILGREVTTLFSGLQQSGNYKVTFDGSSLPGGIYFYRLNTGEFSQTRKMLLLK